MGEAYFQEWTFSGCNDDEDQKNLKIKSSFRTVNPFGIFQ